MKYITYYITSLVNKIGFYNSRVFAMSIMLYIFQVIRGIGSFDPQNYKIYNVKDEIYKIDNDSKKYYWISIENTREEFDQSKTPYLKFWPNFSKGRNYPDIDYTIDKLFRCNVSERRLHKNKTNIFLVWFANYFIFSFLHTTYDDDLLPYNKNYFLGKPMYGASLEEEKILRSFKNGFVKMHSDNTPLRLSDLTENQKSHVFIENPNNQDAFISGNDRANISVGHYITQTILLRNHNKLCKQIMEINNSLTDEQIYQLAKTINLYQFIKIVLGPYISTIGNTTDIKSDYYSTSEFTYTSINATWEYNLVYQWHNMLPEKIGNVKLTELAYKPELFYKKNIGEWINLAVKTPIYEQRLNNSLPFLLPVEKQAILASRQSNLSSYCEYRTKLKLSVPKTFMELTGGDHRMSQNLKDVYGKVENVEFYTGILAEPIESPGIFGETIMKILTMIALNALPVILHDYRRYITETDNNLLQLVDKFKYNKDYFLDNLTENEKQQLPLNFDVNNIFNLL